jgi:uncharacterized protein YjbJ (UPF0337 family)
LRADRRSAYSQEQVMGINEDQVKGRVNQVEGKVKEVVGKAVGNKDLEVKGSVQKNIGKVQTVVGDAKADITDALKKP